MEAFKCNDPEGRWIEDMKAELVEPKPKSWAPEVLVEGKWAGNAIRLATKDECERYCRALLMRWFVPTDSRSVPSDDPPNYEIDEAGNIRAVGEVTT